MRVFDRLILRVKRAETPLTRFLRRLALLLINPPVPRVPRILKTPLSLVYGAHFLVIRTARWLSVVFYRSPLFQSKCASYGKRVFIEGLPFIVGHAQIHVGNDVRLGGKIAIFSGKMVDEPKLILKDRCAIGWNTTIVVDREVVIEEDVIVSVDCRINDSDGHCREADLRAAGVAPSLKDIRPVRICRNAWIGNGARIMKGVTIGEGAIIGANSVVMSNIPAYSLAVGNPAEVLMRNFGLPSTAVRRRGASAKAPAEAQRSE